MRGRAFQARSVVDGYGFRAPYADEVFEVLRRLLGAASPRVLDAGCGTGKLARGLASWVERVDAVDPSAEMLARARAEPGGDLRRIHWIHATIEEAHLEGPYGLVTAGASIHWFDLPCALDRFARLVDPAGWLVIVGGDGPVAPAWQAEEYALLLDVGERRTGVRPTFTPFDPAGKEMLRHPQFRPHGVHVTEPHVFRQSVDDYVAAQQSRASLSRQTLGPELTALFEERLRALLAPHVVDGVIEYEHRTRIEWGRPLPLPERDASGRRA